MDHTSHHSRMIKEKETNTGVGTTFRYVEAAEYLPKCLKFGGADEMLVRKYNEGDNVHWILG